MSEAPAMTNMQIWRRVRDARRGMVEAVQELRAVDDLETNDIAAIVQGQVERCDAILAALNRDLLDADA